MAGPLPDTRPCLGIRDPGTPGITKRVVNGAKTRIVHRENVRVIGFGLHPRRAANTTLRVKRTGSNDHLLLRTNQSLVPRVHVYECR